MTLRTFALALTLLSVLPLVPQNPPATFDPVGTWQISTVAEGGAPMMVTATIAGKPGAYTGRAVTPDRTLPLQEVATTPSGMIALFNMAPDGVVIIKVDRAANGGHTGAWAGIDRVYPLTAKRAQ
jgi:hypothetical protein